MQSKLIVSENQKATSSDINNIGNYARASFDDTIRDGMDDRNRYAGFATVQASAASVNVAAGRFYKNGEAYSTTTVSSLDLLNSLPAVAKRIAIIVAWGNAVDTGLESREFLVDATTRATEARSTPTENRRVAYLGFLLGAENSTPGATAIPSDYVAIASVVLTPAGIESITMLSDNQLRSNKSIGAEVDEINDRLADIGPELDTAKSNIAGLAANLALKADIKFATDLAVDLANVKESLSLPDSYTAWGADHFLDETGVDTAFSGYDAMVREGWHFPNTAVANQAVALENALDAKVVVNDNMAIPAFTSVVRLAVEGKDGEYSLADTTVETKTIVQRCRARTRIRYHRCKKTGSSLKWYFTGRYDAEQIIFRRNGESYVSITDYSLFPSRYRHTSVAFYTKKRHIDHYFDRIVTSTSVNGSIVGQTFLQGNDGYLTKVGLYFTRKASSGDVRVLVCETKASGEPDISKVVANTTLLNASITANIGGKVETVVTFTPTPLTKGVRYAVVLISNAAHFIATVSGNKLASGALFYSQDGAFIQAALDRDLTMRLYFAEFSTPIVQVQLQALELAGGIDMIDINADFTQFDGTSLQFQVRDGDGVWKTVGEDATLLTTRPSLAQFRAVFIGTKDIMPALGLGSTRSNVELSRAKTTRTGITGIKTMPSAVNSIKVRARYENWDAAHHASTVTVLVGAGYTTVETVDATTETVAPDDATAIIREYTFNLASARTTFRIKEVGTTDSNLYCNHIADLAWVGFA